MRKLTVIALCLTALNTVIIYRGMSPPPHVVAAANEGIRYINVPGLGTPIARYSHAVSLPAGEDLVFVSGMGGETPDGKLVSESVVEQTRQTMENLKKALEAAGTDFSHVLKMNIFLTDLDHMPELRKVRDAYLDPKRPPVMTTVKILGLVTPGKVEIEVVAARRRS